MKHQKLKKLNQQKHPRKKKRKKKPVDVVNVTVRVTIMSVKSFMCKMARAAVVRRKV